MRKMAASNTSGVPCLGFKGKKEIRGSLFLVWGLGQKNRGSWLGVRKLGNVVL